MAAYVRFRISCAERNKCEILEISHQFGLHVAHYLQILYELLLNPPTFKIQSTSFHFSTPTRYQNAHDYL